MKNYVKIWLVMEMGKILSWKRILVEGDILQGSSSLADGQRDSENGIGAELGLVLGSVQLQHELVDGDLISHLQRFLDQGRSEGLCSKQKPSLVSAEGKSVSK